MIFTENDKSNEVCFYTPDDTLSGVKRVVEKVAKDINRVFNTNPLISKKLEDCAKNVIIPLTIGSSEFLDKLVKDKIVDISEIQGKWEVYGFFIIENPFKNYPNIKNALIIPGSDKRATIYGLFHLSELLGVSPFVDFSDVRPAHLTEFNLSEKYNTISKEPSIKYRGFFINDEWPAFGNWSLKRFGGPNVECYEHVFEMLLRLKGNYMWPAMWSAVFSWDGPGLANAERAEEYGIVMSTSHHESCGRAGEEHRHYRRTTKEYGDEWNFTHNRDGITRFWKDGLKRNKPFDNIYTVGMRGEADSAILGREATLQDNIDLLRDVLTTQYNLMKEEIDPDLKKVKRQFVLFSEVDKFYFGDGKTPGLIETDILDDVTIIMSDDNYGYVRALPDEKLRNHKGGLGLYYHYDFHGPTHCYEWANENYLPRSWEQLTAAYEYGIREIWIVNVGDMGLLEMPLNYFMDMAYDFESHGTKHPNTTKSWTENFVKKNFGPYFSEENLKLMADTIDDYTYINGCVRCETLKDDTYHVTNFLENDRMFAHCQKVIENAAILKSACPKEIEGAFWELFYYSAVGVANVHRIMLTASKNHLYAKQNRIEANLFADKLESYIEFDKQNTEEYHNIDNGIFYGFGLSNHIGFYSWNDEDCKLPIVMRVYPCKKARLLKNPRNSEHYITGGEYSQMEETINDFENLLTEYVDIDLAPACLEEIEYEIRTDVNWLKVNHEHGKAQVKSNLLTVSIDRTKMIQDPSLIQKGTVFIDTAASHVRFIFTAISGLENGIKPNTYIEATGYVSIEAQHFAEKHDISGFNITILEGYGKSRNAIKVLPPLHDTFDSEKDAPYVEYSFYAKESGTYDLDLFFSPTNPTYMDNVIKYGYSINGGKISTANEVDLKTFVTYFSPEWQYGPDNNIRIRTVKVSVNKGTNSLRFYPLSPCVVLEKLVLHSEDYKMPESFLGAPESFCVK